MNTLHTINLMYFTSMIYHKLFTISGTSEFYLENFSIMKICALLINYYYITYLYYVCIPGVR